MFSTLLDRGTYIYVQLQGFLCVPPTDLFFIWDGLSLGNKFFRRSSNLFFWSAGIAMAPGDNTKHLYTWPLPDDAFNWLTRTSSCQPRRNIASSGTRTKPIWPTFMPRHRWVDSFPIFAGNCCCYRSEWPYYFWPFTNIIWYSYLIYLTRDHV